MDVTEVRHHPFDLGVWVAGPRPGSASDIRKGWV